MYSGTTADFNTILSEASRHFYCKLACEEEEYTAGFRSVKISEQANFETDKLSLGGTVATTVEISIDKPNNQITGKEYQLSIGLEINGEIEYCPMCMVTAEKPKEDGGILTFVAYDRMVSKFNSPYFTDILVYPIDGKTILREISEKTGVTIANFSELPNGVMVDCRMKTEDGETAETKPFEGYTYRETIKYLAQIYGTFAVMNRIGELEFRWYTESNYTVELNRSRDDLIRNEAVYEVQKLECTVDQTILSSGNGKTGIQIENPVMTQALLDSVFEKVGSMNYLPATISFQGDCRLDLGDIVTVKSKNGIDIKVPVMSLVFEFDGGLTTAIGSYGSTESEESSSVKGPTARAIDRVYTDLFLVKEVLANKVSVDYLQANYATITNLKAVEARIEKIITTEITAEYLEANYAQIDMANVEVASIAQGFLKNLMVEQGILADRVVSEELTVTNCLTGVSILANDIVAGSLNAAEIEVINLNCANLTVGQINGNQIAPGAINMDNLEKSLSQTITMTETDVKKALEEAGLAKSEATTAQKTADGKNTVFYGEEPTAATSGDIWFKENSIYFYDEDKWIQEQFGTDAILESSITEDHVLDLAITTAKIADLAVTNGKLANLSVTNAKIADATIQSAKIANLDAGKITSGYISADRINAGSITYAKLSSAAVASINALIEVGGRNLIPNSKSMSDFSTSSYSKIDSEDSEGFAVARYIAHSTLAWNGLYTPYIPYSLVRNRTVTLSFWIRSDDYEALNTASGQGLAIDARVYPDTASGSNNKYRRFLNIYTTPKLSDEWQLITASATFTDDYFSNAAGSGVDMSNPDALYFRFNMYNYSLYTMEVKKFKLELGNKATDWTPNPEDVYEEIAEQGIANWCYNNNLTYINGGKIYTGTVTTAKLAASAVTADKIAAGAITTAKLAAGCVTAEQIASGTITADRIASRTITAEKIVAGAITANEIAATTITAGKLASNAVTAAKIASNAVTTAKLAAGAVTAAKISVSSLEAIVAKIGGFTINSTALYNGTGSKTSTTAGIYLGTDAIRAYSSTTAYTHIESGKLTCVGAEIKGDMTILGSLKMVCSSYNETASTVIKQYLDTSGVTTEFCGYAGDVLLSYNPENGNLRIGLDTAISGKLNCTGTIQAPTITATGTITGGTIKTSAGVNLNTVNTALTNEKKLTSWQSSSVVTNVIWYKTRGFVFASLDGVSGATFDNLPSGYRPGSKMWCPVIVQNSSGGTWFNGWMGINTDGSIVIQATGSHGATSWVNCKTSNFVIYGNVMFYVG